MTPERVREVLNEVMDPEFPVSVVDMGLIREIAVDGDTVRLQITFTSTGCPWMAWIEDEIRTRLRAEPELAHIEVETVWDRPWSPGEISEAGRAALRRTGIWAAAGTE